MVTEYGRRLWNILSMNLSLHAHYETDMSGKLVYRSINAIHIICINDNLSVDDIMTSQCMNMRSSIMMQLRSYEKGCSFRIYGHIYVQFEFSSNLSDFLTDVWCQQHCCSPFCCGSVQLYQLVLYLKGKCNGATCSMAQQKKTLLRFS